MAHRLPPACRDTYREFHQPTYKTSTIVTRIRDSYRQKLHVEMQLLDKVLLKLGHSLGLPSKYKLLKKIGAVSSVAVSCSLAVPLSTRCHAYAIAAADVHIIAINQSWINVRAHASARSLLTRQTRLKL
jgi:hypothetical protein